MLFRWIEKRKKSLSNLGSANHETPPLGEFSCFFIFVVFYLPLNVDDFVQLLKNF